MPTPKWFEENKKVTAYISTDLEDALKAWMVENRIKKVTQALTVILEQHLGFAEAPQQVAPGQYATLKQLQELRDRVEVLERDSSSKKSKAKPNVDAKPKVEVTAQLEIQDATNSNSEWLGTREAHEQYANQISYSGFRKLTPEAMLERFGLEADLSRKEGRGKNAKPWIRKI